MRNRICLNWEADTATRIEPAGEVDDTAEPTPALTYGDKQRIVGDFVGAATRGMYSPVWHICHATKPDKAAAEQVGYIPVNERGALLDYYTGSGKARYEATYVRRAIASGVPYTPKPIAILSEPNDPNDNPFG